MRIWSSNLARFDFSRKILISELTTLTYVRLHLLANSLFCGVACCSVCCYLVFQNEGQLVSLYKTIVVCVPDHGRPTICSQFYPLLDSLLWTGLLVLKTESDPTSNKTLKKDKP